MKGKMHIYYDEEADYFEVWSGKPQKCYFEEINDGIFERIDEKTGKVVGIAIFNFKERKIKDNVKITVPLSFELAAEKI